jgi:hypothetical protein
MVIALYTNGNRYSAGDLHFFILADTFFRSFIMASINGVYINHLLAVTAYSNGLMVGGSVEAIKKALKEPAEEDPLPIRFSEDSAKVIAENFEVIARGGSSDQWVLIKESSLRNSLSALFSRRSHPVTRCRRNFARETSKIQSAKKPVRPRRSTARISQRRL